MIHKKESQMNADNKELLCSKCRKRVSYHICKHPEKTIIKDTEICYDEFYGICDECGQEIYVPDWMIIMRNK